ncbi:MAG: Zn-dependent hydrolase [Gammaproteobacteria bacterium]|nr:MAG: Zn-dependent hydrolase [Gammaproteobacteria bacterium]
MIKRLILFSAFVGLVGCQQPSEENSATAKSHEATGYDWRDDAARARANIYAEVTLTADLSGYSDNQKKMLAKLIDAAQIMDKLFWLQAFGEPQPFLSKIKDPVARRFAVINYGPWDRLDGDKPFLTGFGAKPLGANFYPADMSKEEFDRWQQPGKDGLYSLVRRDKAGKLTLVPYHVAYHDALSQAAQLLNEAAALAENKHFAEYLRLRAKALLTDEYFPSDMAWMDMKDNPIELVIGPIETYEDQLFGYRAAFEAYVLLKDKEWSQKLARFAQYLPQLQQGLPVPEQYKAEQPGSDSDLNAYDVIYYAGHSNAGSKTIAINLPNDERVQLKKGTRRLQLKNAMKAKFDHILVPIANVLIDPAQRKHIKFHAFFANTMFHEVAHGLGIKNTINGRGTVRHALKETASALEEGKADILGLYMITKLHEQGVLNEGELMDYYTTFLAGIFRSVRFGASSAHGRANMLRFNYFRQMGAFSRDENTGTYRVNFDNFQKAMTALSHDILTIQGDGDYQRAKKWLDDMGIIDASLQKDLDRLKTANIPVDVVFKQGKKVLGLTP